MRRPRVCFVLNIAPHYRKALLEELDKEERVHYFFVSGSQDMQISRLTDITKLSGFKGYLSNKFSGVKLIYQRGWMKHLFGGYDMFILTGNPGIRSNWLLTIAARLMGKKVYLWTHGLYGGENFIERQKKLLYMRLANGALLYGNFGRMKSAQAGYPRKKMKIVYNSLDTALQLPLRERKEDKAFLRNYFATDAPIAIFIGRLTPQKSLDVLIESIGILKMQGVECNAIIVGSGELEMSLRKRCEEVGVEDNIWFYGDCYDEGMIATLLKCSTICISPGNVGLTAMHAMAYGVPVITHSSLSLQMPEFEAVIKGVTGDFFKYGDSIGLSECMSEWFVKLSDATQREECRKACYNVIDTKYNTSSQARRITKAVLAEFR